MAHPLGQRRPEQGRAGVSHQLGIVFEASAGPEDACDGADRQQIDAAKRRQRREARRGVNGGEVLPENADVKSPSTGVLAVVSPPSVRRSGRGRPPPREC